MNSVWGNKNNTNYRIQFADHSAELPIYLYYSPTILKNVNVFIHLQLSVMSAHTHAGNAVSIARIKHTDSIAEMCALISRGAEDGEGANNCNMIRCA